MRRSQVTAWLGRIAVLRCAARTAHTGVTAATKDTSVMAGTYFTAATSRSVVAPAASESSGPWSGPEAESRISRCLCLDHDGLDLGILWIRIKIPILVVIFPIEKMV